MTIRPLFLGGVLVVIGLLLLVLVYFSWDSCEDFECSSISGKTVYSFSEIQVYKKDIFVIFAVTFLVAGFAIILFDKKLKGL